MNKSICLLVLFSGFLAISLGYGDTANALNTPTGIPDPGFGLDIQRPTRPADWTTERAGYYYIDSSVGSNSYAYGTPQTPRATIPETLSAGSYVEVHGAYSETSGGVIHIDGKGNGQTWQANVSGPVWIVGQNSSNAPTFERKVVVTGRYVYFDTIVISSGGQFQVGSGTTGYPADHIVLRNSEAIGVPSSTSGLVSVIGSSTDPVSNVVVYNNAFHDNGDINATFDQDAHVTSVSNYSSHVWFLGNEIYNASGSGAQVGGPTSGEDNCHHVYYGRNVIHHTRQAGLAVKYASDVIFSQNLIYGMIDTRPLYDTSSSPSKGVGFQYAPSRLWILFNEIHDASYGIYGGSTNSGTWKIYAIGNLIYDIQRPTSVTFRTSAWAEAGIMMQGGTERFIVNNTIYNADAGINGPSVGTQYHLSNNIISNIADNRGHHIWIEDGSSAQSSSLDYSIAHQPGADERVRWGDSTTHTIASLRSVTSQCSHCSNSDPEFVDPANNDFHFVDGSAAHDTGEAHPVYDEFQRLYGLDIKRDINATPRPLEGAWDVGAYEIDPLQLMPPDNVRLLK